jgi:hypothetical protein
VDRKEGHWYRKGREPAESGAFFTPDPMRVAVTHGIGRNNVYTYKVPEHVIRKSGGIRNFDKAPELLIPKKHWSGVKLVGKNETKKDFDVRDDRERRVIMGNPMRDLSPKSKKQKKRDRKAADIERRQQGRKRKKRLRSWIELRTPLLVEALQVRRQSVKERMAKKKPSATFAAARSSKWLWQKLRKKWSKDHPQYIFRKGRLIFVPPEKRRQLKSKIKGRIVKRAKLPGSGHKG